MQRKFFSCSWVDDVKRDVKVHWSAWHEYLRSSIVSSIYLLSSKRQEYSDFLQLMTKVALRSCKR